MRITQKQLDSLLESINKKLGRPLTQYTKDKKGRYTPNIDNIHFDHAYGGIQLNTMMEHGVYLEFGSGFKTKREMWDMLHTIIDTSTAVKQ